MRRRKSFRIFVIAKEGYPPEQKQITNQATKHSMTLQEIKAELEGYKLEEMDIKTLILISRQTNDYSINLHRSARELKDYDISGMPFGGVYVCDQVSEARRNLCSLIEAQAQLYSDFSKRLDAEMARRQTIQ